MELSKACSPGPTPDMWTMVTHCVRVCVREWVTAWVAHNYTTLEGGRWWGQVQQSHFCVSLYRADPLPFANICRAPKTLRRVASRPLGVCRTWDVKGMRGSERGEEPWSRPNIHRTCMPEIPFKSRVKSVFYLKSESSRRAPQWMRCNNMIPFYPRTQFQHISCLGVCISAHLLFLEN